MLAAAFIAVGAALMIGTPGASGADSAVRSTPDADEDRVLGRWVRPDGGYILELMGKGKDGGLKAAYFNPRSINVAWARLTRRDGELIVFVELRDVNYPGSTYTLRYDPKSDRLKGTYFQAVEGRTFTVEFSRAE
jgi:hypothetical protein